MAIEWRLRQVMARNNVWTGSELLRLMERKAGYSMTPPSISALLNDPPKLMRMETLDALCTALDCSPNDLIEHKVTNLGKLPSTTPIIQKENSKKFGNGRSLPPI